MRFYAQRCSAVLLFATLAGALGVLAGLPLNEVQAVQKADDPVAPKVVRKRGYKPPSAETKARHHRERFAAHGYRMRDRVAASTPPAEFDCKDQGWCGDPGDQAQCGSCYLYSTVKCATSSLVQGGAGKVDQFRLSFQFGMDCHDFGGCNGGNGTEVIDWMCKNGWPAESYIDAAGKPASDYPPYTDRKSVV